VNASVLSSRSVQRGHGKVATGYCRAGDGPLNPKKGKTGYHGRGEGGLKKSHNNGEEKNKEVKNNR